MIYMDDVRLNLPDPISERNENSGVEIAVTYILQDFLVAFIIFIPEAIFRILIWIGAECIEKHLDPIFAQQLSKLFAIDVCPARLSCIIMQE